MDDTIRAYLQGLENGDYEQITGLFSVKAIVHSPLYGEKPAREFYHALLSDSSNSKITLLNTYHQPGGRRSAVNFIYEWALANGQQVRFDCVDLFEWDEDGLISRMKIIYDTASTRPAFEAQQNQRRR